MCPLTQRLLDDFPAVRTILASVVRGYGNRYHPKNLAEILQPIAESRPCSIRNRFRQLSIPDHISHLQVLVGNQVVRLDYASCQLHGKIFTLPTYLEVLSRETVSRFSSIFRAFLSTRKLATQTLERLLRLPEMSWIFYSLPIRVGVEVSQPNIQSNSLSSWRSQLMSLNIKTKLNVVPISTADNPNPFHLVQLIKVQVTSSPQLEASSFKTIGESDSSSILRQLPPTGFVLYRAMCLMLLEAWEPFLMSLLFTVVVEPSNGRPSSFSRGLTSHRVEFVRPREFFGENFAISAQFISPNLLVVHPVSDARIANESSSTNGFIKPFILLLFALKFCLKYQHFTLLCLT